MRSPHLYDTMRRFCLGAFSVFHGEDLPFAFEEHAPSFYEYRPLVKSFIEGQAERLRNREDVRAALDDLAREPAARVYTDAYRTVLVPLLVRVAEGCGGFDWDDTAFDRAYEEMESLLFGSGHAYAAVAPLVGISCGSVIELGPGLRMRPHATGELAALWPESSGLLPRDFGREVDRTCVLELERQLAKGEAEAPDAPGELADAVTAVRLATAAPIAAGPVLFERLDWRPFGIRPVLPIAATPPPGEPTRLDPFRAQVAARLIPQLALADGDARLGDALDRWELSLFQDDPFRAEQLRHALDAALGDGDGTWAAAMRAAALLNETDAEPFRAPGPDLVRRTLVAMLEHGDRAALVRELDAKLLGSRETGTRKLAHIAS
ncbi:MAG: hypothetical protein E6F98_05915 [Actinobacteria bacterium]|nr:MAG: hypothetical protein E6F98_05915 [Actinomycetota bacterium]